MPSQGSRRVARVARQELAAVSAYGSDEERSRHLRSLLSSRGINPDRLYHLEYHPHRRCWLLIQTEAELGRETDGPGPPTTVLDRLYQQSMLEFHRTAQSAVLSLAMQSAHFARFGSKYELPVRPEEFTPAGLAEILGRPMIPPESIRFTGEGGWQADTGKT